MATPFALPYLRSSIPLCCGFLLFACASDEPAPAHGPDDLDHRDAGLDEDGGEEEGCTEGLLEACDCDDGSSGQSRCTDGELSACRGCSDDEPPPGNGSKCVPGHYQGTIDGVFHPQAGGLDGLTGPLIPELVNLPLGPAPFGFTLQAKGTEFFTVEGGCFDASSSNIDAGVPDVGQDAGAGTEVINRILFIGSVDCATGKLDGEIRGYYESTSLSSLGMGRKKYFYKGPISATFNAATQTFEGGKWEGKEPPVLFGDLFAPSPGGGGTWSAMPDGTEGSSASTEEECLGERFPIESFPKK